MIDDTSPRSTARTADYASNTLEPRTFPRGLDVEAITTDALERAGREDRDPGLARARDAVHLPPSGAVPAGSVRLAEDLSDHRWTVDTPEDYELVRRIYDALGRDDFGWRDALAVVEANPDWSDLNRHVEQKVAPGA